MSTFTTERNAVVRLSGIEYDVEYSISGNCWYEAAQISGPPERCYPEDSGSEVEEIKVLRLYVEGVQVEFLPKLAADLVKELEKLPLDAYLYEAWGNQEPPERDDYDLDLD